MLPQQNQVSIVVGCRDRTSFLRKALPSWLRFPNVAEIIITDWGSSENVELTVSEVLAAFARAKGQLGFSHGQSTLPPGQTPGQSTFPRIHLVRVEQVNRWILSLALNLGISLAVSPLLLKVDCDSVLASDFFEQHPLADSDKAFYAGNWKLARDENEKHLNGVVFVPLSPFRAIGGYNEHIRTYGWDDTDLYDRLVKHGLERKSLAFGCLAHLAHGNDIRENLPSLQGNLKCEILRNMFICRELPWSASRTTTQYTMSEPRVVKENDSIPGKDSIPVMHSIPVNDSIPVNNPITTGDDSTPAMTPTRISEGQLHAVTRTVWRPVDPELKENKPSLQVWNDCGLLALRTALNDEGITWEMTDKRSSSFLTEVLKKAATQPRLWIEPKNGLGNRLRALASAAVVAQQSQHVLIVVWVPDFHCEAKFEHLFQQFNLLVVSKRPAECADLPNLVDLPKAVVTPVAGSAAQLPSGAPLVPVPLPSSGAPLVPAPWPSTNVVAAAQTTSCHSSSLFSSMTGSSCAKEELKPLESLLTEVKQPTPSSDRDSRRDSTTDSHVVTACVLNNPLTNWSKESKWLRDHLKPTAAIAALLETENARHHLESAIGVHIRMGLPPSEHKYEDCSTWAEAQQRALETARRNSDVSVFAHEMENLWKVTPDQRFFLCADNPRAYEFMSRRFPDQVTRGLVFWLNKSTYDRGLTQQKGAVLDVFLLSRCVSLLGSPWSSFTELASRIAGGGTLPNGQSRLRVAGKDFCPPKYALLCYPTSYNLGDDIQSLAARQYLPRVDYLIDRDAQCAPLRVFSPITYEPSVLPDNTPLRSIRILGNGWHDSRVTRFPYSPALAPYFVAFHLNDHHDLFNTAMYSVMRKSARLDDLFSAKDAARLAFFKANEPIGTRDMHTLHLLQEKGIEAFHTCCLTLTLKPTRVLTDGERENGEILITDVHLSDKELFDALVPKRIQAQAQYIEHAVKSLLPQAKKEQMAQALLDRYQRAKCVITSRLHCALPSIAFGTPTLFLFKPMKDDVRFDETLRVVLGGDGCHLPENWDWDHPRLQPSQVAMAKKVASALRERVENAFATGY